VKQNLSEAKPASILSVGFIIAVLIFDSGCVKRARQYSVETYSEAEASKADRTRVNINTASAEDLERLPGIGRVIAERIIEHRSQHGAFRRVEHVMMVHGISERKFQAMEPLITVHHTP
jgi:comEA protein